MGHGGPLVPVIPREVSVLSGPFGGRVEFPPPCLRIRLDEMIGGGDIHQSPILLSFSSSIFERVPPQRPGFASERKETLTA